MIPYLYGYSIVENGGAPPFGELSHGAAGLRDDLATLIGVRDDRVLLDFVRLLAAKKRKANKLPCPCGAGLRVGRCHNRKLNILRAQLGRAYLVLYFMVHESLLDDGASHLSALSPQANQRRSQ